MERHAGGQSIRRLPSSHLPFPESHGAIEPPLRDGPLAQSKAVGKAIEHLDLRIRSLGPYPACPLLHRAVGGDPVVRPHAAVGGRLVPRHLRQARILHDDHRGTGTAFLAKGPGSARAEPGRHARSGRPAPQGIIAHVHAQLLRVFVNEDDGPRKVLAGRIWLYHARLRLPRASPPQ